MHGLPVALLTSACHCTSQPDNAVCHNFIQKGGAVHIWVAWLMPVAAANAFPLYLPG